MNDKSDIITLSSDDDEEIIPKKRARLITIDTNIKQPSLKTLIKPKTYIVLSDEDEETTKSEDDSVKSDNTEDVTIIADPTDPLPNIINVEETNADNVVDTSEALNNGKELASQDSEADEEDTTEADKDANEFFAFIDDCLQTVAASDQKVLLHEKLPAIRKFFNKIKFYPYNKDELLGIIRRTPESVKTNPEVAVLRFVEVLQWLKSSYVNLKREQIHNEKNMKTIRKLRKALELLKRKLKQLEAAEINFDDEEDSVYLQHERYAKRFNAVHKRLCMYMDENPFQGRLVYLKLDFVDSKYTEINRAINKKYKDNFHFPSYFELDRLIRKCVQKHNLDISETSLKCEMQHVFEKLVKLLQERRNLDSFQFRQDFLDDGKDPAEDNPEISETLKANQSTSRKKLDDVFEKYARLQEEGVDPNLSSDSDDSNYVESDVEGTSEETNN